MRLWAGLRGVRAAEAPRRWGSDRWDPRSLGLRGPRWVMHKLALLARAAALHEVPTGVPGGCGSGDAAAALHRAAIGGTLDHVTCSGIGRVLKLAVLARAAPTDGVAARLLGVAEDTLVAAGAGTARKVAAALGFGDFGSATGLPAGTVACGGVVLGFASLHLVGHIRPFGVSHQELGLKVEPVGPEWQCLRALPVDALADDDGRGV